PYESPRLAAVQPSDQQALADDDDDGIDPREKLKDIVRRYIEAQKASQADETESEIIPPGEIADLDPGPRPGPDDPKPPGEAAPPKRRCAPATRVCRSWCSRAGGTRSARSRRSTSAPTTTSPSRSAWTNFSPACARRCATSSRCTASGRSSGPAISR